MKIELAQGLEGYVDAEVKSGRFPDPDAVVSAAVRRMQRAQAGIDYGNLGALADGDIMALAFIVMMEAAKSAREDLKAIMDRVKAINAAKRGLRELAAKISRDVASNACRGAEVRALDLARGLGSERAYHKVEVPCLDPDAPGGVRLAAIDLWPAGKLAKRAELETILDDIKGRLDSMSEMGEMESLRLQMAMDRMSKMMTTLSNLLRKASETAQSITQNLK
jgi:Arc/MetJ-type ribon-helix-helix transcriptional regulator